jgi:hypothetical protein
MLLKLLTRIVSENQVNLNEAFNFIDENKHFIQLFFHLRKELNHKTLKQAAKEKERTTQKSYPSTKLKLFLTLIKQIPNLTQPEHSLIKTLPRLTIHSMSEALNFIFKLIYIGSQLFDLFV